MLDIKSDLAHCCEEVNSRLEALLKNDDARFKTIFDSVNYSVSCGGKRIRPYLVMKFCELAKGSREAAIDLACALEMVHTYSLIHDDLPCMDNDDMRRGKPTNHIVFGEATATLAGDALLTYAFEVIANANADALVRIRAVKALSENAGMYGMIGGQILDMQGEKEPLGYEDYVTMNACKTGCLINAAAKLGLISASVEDESELMKDALIYSSRIGRAFQVTDDILDVTSSVEELGKPIGSDAENGKTTVLSYMSIDEARALAARLTDEAVSAIEKYEGSEKLCVLANYLLTRKS